MAMIGLRYPICAQITEDGGTTTYSGGTVIGRAIKADMSIEVTDDKLYADDAVAETAKEFKSGKVTLNADDIPDEIKAVIFGHKQEDAGITGETEVKMLISGGNDDGSPVGLGFYGVKQLNGSRKYRAIWLTKVKFGVNSESLETKGESISFQTPTIEGDIMTDAAGNWKKEVTLSTASAAIAWLNKMAGIEVSA